VHVTRRLSLVRVVAVLGLTLAVIGVSVLVVRPRHYPMDQGGTGETICSDFLAMSNRQRTEVIRDMGIEPAFVSDERQTAVKECAPGRSADEELQFVLGP
jgi:hypothetical protein